MPPAQSLLARGADRLVNQNPFIDTTMHAAFCHDLSAIFLSAL